MTTAVLESKRDAAWREFVHAEGLGYTDGVANLAFDGGWAAATANAPVLAEVAAERARQDEKWGEQNHLDGTGPYVRWLGLVTPTLRDALGEAVWLEHRAKTRTDAAAKTGDVTWRDILFEEVAEAFAAPDVDKLRAELVQVAAVAAQWVEAIDRRGH